MNDTRIKFAHLYFVAKDVAGWDDERTEKTADGGFVVWQHDEELARVDPNGRLVRAVPAWEEILGVETPAHWYKFVAYLDQLVAESNPIADRGSASTAALIPVPLCYNWNEGYASAKINMTGPGFDLLDILMSIDRKGEKYHLRISTTSYKCGSISELDETFRYQLAPLVKLYNERRAYQKLVELLLPYLPPGLQVADRPLAEQISLLETADGLRPDGAAVAVMADAFKQRAEGQHFFHVKVEE